MRKKTFVFSNLAISLDGKISTPDRPCFPLGTQEDHLQMGRLRKRSDAILIGASTFRTLRSPFTKIGKSEKKNGAANGKSPANLVLSSKLDGISPQWSFFKAKNLNRILIVSHEALPSKIRQFEKSCLIWKLKKPTAKNPVAFQILQFAESHGIKNLLVEGGGNVMWDFVQFNLIDEFHVTVTPKIIGGKTAPTLVDGKGFKTHEILSLKLRQCRVVGEELFLVYAKISKNDDRKGSSDRPQQFGRHKNSKP